MSTSASAPAAPGSRPVVIFDFDGTLVDTGGAVMQTVARVLAARGFTPQQMGDLRRFIGPPLLDCFRDTCGFTQKEAEAVTAEYRAVFDELGPADYPVFPGMAELADELRAQGRRIAIATSRKEDRAREMAHELGLDQFEVIFGLNEPIRHTKADSIRDVLSALKASPANAVLIGDTVHDIRGAHEVGLPCIAVAFGATDASVLIAAGADAVCHDVAALRTELGLRGDTAA